LYYYILIYNTGHIQPVTSVSWSKNGRLLLSSSTDWMVILYDVLEGTIKKKFQFESLVLSTQMHPKLNDFCIVCVFNESPILLNLNTDERKILPETEDIENKLSIDNKKLQKNPTGTIAVFNKQGNKIFIGNWNGVIIAFDMNLLQILYHFKVSTAPIKSIQFSKSGKQFLVNSTDRIIRLYEGEDSKTIAREFQDPVNKVQWKKCCFSCDDDYIIAGSAQKSQHNIYIWNRESGQLIKTLEGPKEAIIDLVWHPNRPIIVSIAQTGAAFIWASNYTENWSAFAPDFKELEENEEYIEKEDEFDIYSEEENNKKKKTRRK
jgi:COMPASS component SWD1